MDACANGHGRKGHLERVHHPRVLRAHRRRALGRLADRQLFAVDDARVGSCGRSARLLWPPAKSHMSSLSAPRWRSVPPDAIVWREWDGEFVVRNERSGSSHLLGTLAGSVLQVLLRADGAL